MNETPTNHAERPHPGDTSAAETQTIQRRLMLGIVIAVSLNIGFLIGGAAIANYVSAIFRPLFYKTDRMVYVRLDVDPLPSPAATQSPAPAATGDSVPVAPLPSQGE